MCPAIHINSRSWLRSSSTREPSDPPLRVFASFGRAHPGNVGWRARNFRQGRVPDVFVQTVWRKVKETLGRGGCPWADGPHRKVEALTGRLFEPRSESSPRVPVG